MRPAAPETETAEAAEFDFLPLVQRLRDAAEQGVDDNLGVGHLLDERRLRQAVFGHGPFSSARGVLTGPAHPRRTRLVERPFAHQYETGGLRRVWVRGHQNARKRLLIQAACRNLGLLLHSLTGVGTPRSLQGRALSAIWRLIERLIDRWGPLTAAWGCEWMPAAFVGSVAHRQAA